MLPMKLLLMSVGVSHKGEKTALKKVKTCTCSAKHEILQEEKKSKIPKWNVSSLSTVHGSAQWFSLGQPLHRKLSHSKTCASKEGSRLTFSSATVLPGGHPGRSCYRQKIQQWLRQCTYHHVSNSWMWQECCVPQHRIGSDFSAAASGNRRMAKQHQGSLQIA